MEGNASFVRLCKGCAHLAVASVNPAPPQLASAHYAKAPDLVSLLPSRQGEPPGENPAPVWCLLPIRRFILPAALASAPEPDWLSRDFGREAAVSPALGHSALWEPEGTVVSPAYQTRRKTVPLGQRPPAQATSFGGSAGGQRFRRIHTTAHDFNAIEIH